MLVRFLRGLFGLGSGQSTPDGGGIITEPFQPDVIVVPPKGKPSDAVKARI
jgi:hypothetical protein